MILLVTNTSERSYRLKPLLPLAFRVLLLGVVSVVVGTTSYKNNTNTLAGVARWCLKQQKGILTPTGKPKKPPTYWIADCPDCGLVLTSSSEVTIQSMNDGKAKCVKRVLNKEVRTPKTWAKTIPQSVVCRKTLTHIETIGETE